LQPTLNTAKINISAISFVTVSDIFIDILTHFAWPGSWEWQHFLTSRISWCPDVWCGSKTGCPPRNQEKTEFQQKVCCHTWKMNGRPACIKN